MKHVYIPLRGDRNLIIEKTELLSSKTNQELIASYNKEAKMGIVGVHRQIIHIIALNLIFKERFEKSPVKIEDNTVISLTGTIIYDQDKETYKYKSVD